MKVTVSLSTDDGGQITQESACNGDVESFVAAVQHAMEHVGNVATHLRLIQVTEQPPHGEHEAPEQPLFDAPEPPQPEFVVTDEVPVNHIQVTPETQTPSETE